jgi:hypothetical protein
MMAGTPSPACFFFHLQKICSPICIFRQTSLTDVPLSACRKEKATCSPMNRFHFTLISLRAGAKFCPALEHSDYGDAARRVAALKSPQAADPQLSTCAPHASTYDHSIRPPINSAAETTYHVHYRLCKTDVNDNPIRSSHSPETQHRRMLRRAYRAIA